MCEQSFTTDTLKYCIATIRKSVPKMLPARFCSWMGRLEEMERVTEGAIKDERVQAQLHFVPALCQLIENERVAGKPRHTSFSLVITFLTAPSALSVLCICCLRVLPWNKPQWGIYLPNRRNPNAFLLLISSSYSYDICSFQKRSPAWTNTLIMPLKRSPCPPFDNLFRGQTADCAL